MNNTNIEYDNVIKKCRELFEAKLSDYGTSWRILRLSSLTDQIFIKASRIRSIQESGEQMIDEGMKKFEEAFTKKCEQNVSNNEQMSNANILDFSKFKRSKG